MSSFRIAQGDSFPISFGLRDGRGQAITPPAGATATIRLVERDTGRTVTGSIALVGDVGTWTPMTSDSAVPGLYDAQVTVIYLTGEVRHFPTKVGPSALSGFLIEICANP